MKRLFLPLLIGFAGAHAQQIPELMNYQGRITDASGAPVETGTWDYEVRFWTGLEAGVLIWGPQVFDGEIAQGHGPKVQISEGFFNLILGPVDIEGRMLSQGLQGPDVYLELKAKDGEVVGSRQRILSSAFALKAKQAEASLHATNAENAVNAQSAVNATNAENAEIAESAVVATRAIGLVGSDGQTYGWETIFENGDPSNGRLRSGIGGFDSAYERVVLDTLAGQLRDQSWPIFDSEVFADYRRRLNDLRTLLGSDWESSAYADLRERYQHAQASFIFAPSGLSEEEGIRMIYVPPGTFNMGSPDSEKDRDSDESPVTQVTLTKGYWLSQYEITQHQYETITGSNPSSSKAPRYPVNTLSWITARSFCNDLTASAVGNGAVPQGGDFTNYIFALPTEAQWEYACRAGSQTRFHYGDDIFEVDLKKYARFRGDGSGSDINIPSLVGSRMPNAWGFYDMNGNIREWCFDFYLSTLPGGSVEDYFGPSSAVEVNPADGDKRVIKGGAYNDWPVETRSAARTMSGEKLSTTPVSGFRIAFRAKTPLE